MRSTTGQAQPPAEHATRDEPGQLQKRPRSPPGTNEESRSRRRTDAPHRPRVLANRRTRNLRRSPNVGGTAVMPVGQSMAVTWETSARHPPHGHTNPMPHARGVFCRRIGSARRCRETAFHSRFSRWWQRHEHGRMIPTPRLTARRWGDSHRRGVAWWGKQPHPFPLRDSEQPTWCQPRSCPRKRCGRLDASPASPRRTVRALSAACWADADDSPGDRPPSAIGKNRARGRCGATAFFA